MENSNVLIVLGAKGRVHKARGHSRPEILLNRLGDHAEAAVKKKLSSELSERKLAV